MLNESAKRREKAIRKHEYDHYKHCPDLVEFVNYKRNANGRVVFGSVGVKEPANSYDAERLIRAAKAVSNPSPQDQTYLNHLERKLRLFKQIKR